MAMGPFAQGFFSVFKPQPKLTVSEWAERYRLLPAGGSAEPGPWRNDRTPYLVEIMDALSSSSRAREVVLCKSSQIGATEAGMNWLMYLIDYVGGPILALQPSDDDASEWSKQRLSPSFELCPRIRSKITPAKSRDSGNTILGKQFTGGYLFLSGTHSPASLASKPIGNLYGDEIDRYPGNVGGEGDPISLARQRTSTFPRAKLFFTSTPTLLGSSRIWDLYQDSDRRIYEVPCPYCGHCQELKMERLVWERGDCSDVRLACVGCGRLIEEGHKTAMLADGRWRATNPGHWRVGFHLSSLYSPVGWLSWSDIAKRHEESEGDAGKMQVVVNTILGLPWEEDNETIAEEFLKRRIETYAAQVPAGVLALTMAVDVQNDRLEYEIRGWGDGEESWGIEYRIIDGDPSVLESGDPDKPSVWERLDEYRRRTFGHEDGGEIRIACTFVDSGGSFTDIVYQYTKDRLAEQVYSVKGGSQSSRPLLNKPIPAGKCRARLFVLGVNKGKDLVFARLKVERPGPGYCHFPSDENLGYDGRYYAGLVSERKRVVVKDGMKAVKWILPKKARNEPFDLAVYGAAAIRKIDPDWERLRAQRAVQRGRCPVAPQAKSEQPVRTPPVPARRPAAGVKLIQV